MHNIYTNALNINIIQQNKVENFMSKLKETLIYRFGVYTSVRYTECDDTEGGIFTVKVEEIPNEIDSVVDSIVCFYAGYVAAITSGMNPLIPAVLNEDVRDGQTVINDHTITGFHVSVRSMNLVGEETIKDLIEKKFEVVDIRKTSKQFFLVKP